MVPDPGVTENECPGMSRSSTPDAAERYERLLEVQSLTARVSREIGPALDLDQVLVKVLAAMRSLVAFDGGVISLLEGDELVMAATDPAPSPNATMRTPASTGIAGQVLATGVSALSPDLRVDPRITDQFREIVLRRGLAPPPCVPPLLPGGPLGTIPGPPH